MDLREKIGPLPVGAWVAVIAGGLALSFYMNRSSARRPASQPPVEAIAAGPYVGGSPGTQGAVVMPGGPADRIDLTDPEPPTTNAQWRQRAFAAVTSEGVGTVAAWNALTRYLNGQDMSSAERSILERALAMVGLPPEGAPDVQMSPAPPADPAPAPTPPAPAPPPSIIPQRIPTPMGGGAAGDDPAYMGSATRVRTRVAAMRANRNLPPDPASDAIWVQRIYHARTHTLADARTAIDNLARRERERILAGR